MKAGIWRLPLCVPLLLAACAASDVREHRSPEVTVSRAQFLEVDAASAEVQESRAERILRKVAEARAYCGGVDFEPAQMPHSARIVLCGTLEGAEELRTVVVHFTNEGRDQRAVRSETPGCTARYRGGTGPTRFHADVRCGGEKFITYRARHFSDSARRFIGYTPYHPDLHEPALADEGMLFLEEVIREVKRDLVEQGVPSRAFPGRLIGQVYYDRILLALAGIEQADHDAFETDPIQTLASSYINYALNREHAFTLVCSYRSACGPMQFTRGAYKTVRAAYPSMSLPASFESVRELRVALKAAIGLLDLELARLPNVRTLFERDASTAGAFLAAAYNGGGGAASYLVDYLVSRLIDLARVGEVALPRKFPKGRGWRETPIFVEKYLWTIRMIEERARSGSVRT